MNEVSVELVDLTTQRIRSSPTRYTSPNETIKEALARVVREEKEPQYVTVETEEIITILYRANIIGSNPNPPWYTILVERKNTGVSARIDARNFDTRFSSLGDVTDVVFDKLIAQGVTEHAIWYASKRMPTLIPKLKELFDTDISNYINNNDPKHAKFNRMDIIIYFLDTIGMSDDVFKYQNNDGEHVTVVVPKFPSNPLTFMGFVNSCCEGDTGFQKEVSLRGNRTLKFVTSLSDNMYYMFPCSYTEGNNYGFTRAGNYLEVVE